jgi:hypothetical protein
MPISTITANSVTNNSLTTDQFASTAVHGQRNLIINGAMTVAQRGTSFTSSSVNEYSLDRWRTEGYGLSTVISQQTFTSGQTNVPGFPENYVRITTNSAVASGQYWAFQQRIEKSQQIKEGAQNFTLSFWIKSVSGTIAANTFSYGIAGTRENNPEITTNWQKITYSFSYTVSSAGAYESLYLVHLAATAPAISVDIALAQLEVGEQATPFEHRSYGDTLLQCQRYLFKGDAMCLGSADSAGNIQLAIQTPVNLRANPTLVHFSSALRGAVIATATGAAFSAMQAPRVTISVTNTGSANTLVAGFGGSASATLDAEL